MKILFFLPYGGRTGSEIVLYNLICNADRRKMEMAVTCPQGGPLLKAFPADVSTFTHANEEAIALIHEQVRPDAWYVNTITQLNLLQLARNLGVPCVLHTHELEQMLFDLTPEAAEEMVSSPQLVIASSEAAADMMRALGRKEGMEVSYSSIDLAKARSQPGASAQIKSALGIKKDDFVWAMSGTLDPNKNPVRFVEIAHALLEKHPRAHFIWIGGSENAYSRFTKARAKMLGLDKKVTWIPALGDNYYDYLDVADGFVLTSNRDCFPLVMIEIAALGKPLVSFDSGGVREFFRPGMGVLIKDSWNVADIATAMIRVMDKKVDFDAGVSRKRAAEFDVSRQVKHWQSLLKRHLKTFSATRDEAGISSKPKLTPRDRKAAGTGRLASADSLRNPAFLTIYSAGPSGYSEDRALEIPYWTQRWSHFRIALKHGLGISPLRVDPMKGPGLIDIAGLTLRSAKSGKVLWRANRRAGGLESLDTGGSAIRIPHHRLARVFSYAEDPQILLPLLAGPDFDAPLRLEIWLRIETRAEPICEALVELNQFAVAGAQLAKKLKAREEEIVQMRGEIDTLNGQLEQMRLELVSKSEALTQREGEIAQRGEELALAKKQIAETEADLDRARTELLSLKEEFSFQTSALEGASKLTVSLQDELKLKGDQLDHAARELAATTQELTRVGGELAVLKRRMLDQQAVLEDLRKKPFRLALQRFVNGKPTVSQSDDGLALPKGREGNTFWIEHPTAPSKAGERVIVSGWVVTAWGERIEGVEAIVNGEKVAGVHGLERADVGAAHPNQSDYRHSGFVIDLKLPAGSHQLSLRHLTRGRGWTTFCSFQHDVGKPEAPG